MEVTLMLLRGAGVQSECWFGVRPAYCDHLVSTLNGWISLTKKGREKAERFSCGCRGEWQPRSRPVSLFLSQANSVLQTYTLARWSYHCQISKACMMVRLTISTDSPLCCCCSWLLCSEPSADPQAPPQPVTSRSSRALRTSSLLAQWEVERRLSLVEWVLSSYR
jgi:hypothetical protein